MTDTADPTDITPETPTATDKTPAKAALDKLLDVSPPKRVDR
jgi:hypothetical protein